MSAERIALLRFQSTPAIAGGRIHLHLNRPNLVRLVSIHARHCWRANPAVFWCAVPDHRVSIHARHCWRANPTWGHASVCACKVSIHARHCWRANPRLFGKMSRATDCFNPRPPLLAGESPAPAQRRQHPHRFNPRPPLLAGESLITALLTFFCLSFNPRPPLLAGESPTPFTLGKL